MRLLRLRPTCLTNKYPAFKGVYYNDLITQVEVQILWLLCPRLNQSSNGHSIENVVSSGQNTLVVLGTEK